MTKEKSRLVADYIFETSWEVCNKVGGIYTVVSTKALTLVNEYNDNYLLIGPDVWKETHKNPDFIEDKFLYRTWKQKAENEGLRLRIGRWDIAGRPVVILVDFTEFFKEKDKIFTWFWETYKLDSLSGGWDYVEPVLFGYAAGKIIESFYNFNLSHNDKLIAQFHEWMTGAGVLYLKNMVPQVGTVFTTHATVLGRSIAGNGLPLYRDLETYHPDAAARQFGVIAKQSMEFLSAREADGFTTVSPITDKECRQFLGRNADVITPNGFEDNFVPGPDDFPMKRQEARRKLLDVAEALVNQKLPEDSILMINSGRYEFRNKGIDLFIDALGQLDRSKETHKTYIAYITIPAYQFGPRKELLERMEKKEYHFPTSDEFFTHILNEPENDAIMQRIRRNDMHNRPEDQVKLVFVPAYLNGNDGIFDLSYYDLLIGFDGSIFPSYYEPWGYTPLESLAFHIPSITTSLAGFGQWINTWFPDQKECINVIKRDDDNESEVVSAIVSSINTCSHKSPEEIEAVRDNAFAISRSALWSNLVNQYYEVYSIALEKVQARYNMFAGKLPLIHPEIMNHFHEEKPEWKKVLIQPSIPENLNGLNRLSKNLWWAWNKGGADLFEMIDPELWKKSKFNPVAMIEMLTFHDLQKLSKNAKFITQLEKVLNDFDNYISSASEKKGPSVTYFSMEFGLHDSVKIFSGGLGILAGDYLKEASDSNYPLIGIGLLYRYGYFRQQINITGDQVASFIPQKFTHMPLIPVRDEDGNWMKITLALHGRNMYAKIWRVDVGRIPLYLMDSDIEENIEADREITNRLYDSDPEIRLRQEILLGIGGIRLLNLLNLEPDLYHSNEGHSAFIGLERLRNYMITDHLSFSQAIEAVRSTTLFTTHTPVPAGHDVFSEDLLRKYFSHFPAQLNIKWDEFMSLGKIKENDPEELFSMSILAAKLSQEMNGVSKIHADVSKEMFRKLYPGYYPKELHIGYVTNGVHFPTWVSPAWFEFYIRVFGKEFLSNQSDSSYWQKIREVDDEVIWKIRTKEKENLFNYIQDRFQDEMTHRNENPKLIFRIKNAMKKQALTIGFARRFATYKRAYLLFSNMERLAKIVNNPKKPVQFIFAGKAHPNDKGGQDLIRKIYEISKQPEFIGKILFIENYDIELAQYMIRGVDIWLNTPKRPQEASGTSGEKAVMNGVINFSILDGWWAEGYRPDAGWALKEEVTYQDETYQDELDAENIYTILEDEIIPIFYTRNSGTVPHQWVSYIKNSIADIAPHFTMKRQLDDYINQYYNKMYERSLLLKSKNFEKARQLAAWKRKVHQVWDNISVVSVTIPDSTHKPLILGEPFKAEIVLDVNELSGNDVGIEILFGKKVNDEVKEPIFIREMELVSSDQNLARFSVEIPIEQAGVYDFAFRVFPKNPLLPHRQDFNLIKWI